MSTPGTVNYPASLDDAVSLLEVSNNAETTLSSSLSDVATTANVTSTTLFPDTGAISINDEIMYYTGKTGTSFTGLTRGSDGTTAASHANGDDVAGNIIARHHAVLAEALIATQGELDGLSAVYSPLGHTHTFASLTSKPTTISGYGIVDAFTQVAADALYSALGHTHSFASLTSKPTTIAGYGITDFNSLGDARWLGITDTAVAATALATARNINGVAFDGTANITVTAAAGTLTGTTLNASVVTSSLTAVGTIATGVWQGSVIGVAYIGTGTPGAGTYVDGATGAWTALPSSGGSPGGSETQVQFNDSSAFGGDAGLTYNKTTNVLTNTGGGLVVTQGTITDPLSALSITGTWNDAADTFYGIFQNVTVTNAHANSRFLMLQSAGSMRFSVGLGSASAANAVANVSGDASGAGAWNLMSFQQLGTEVGRVRITDYGAGLAIAATAFHDYTDQWKISTILATFRSNYQFTWSSTALEYGTADTGFKRNAAGVMEINNGTGGTFRDLKLRDLIATAALNVQGPAASVGSGISIGGATRTTIGATGGASALPANPLGYLDWYVGSTAIAIPYYTRGA